MRCGVGGSAVRPHGAAGTAEMTASLVAPLDLIAASVFLPPVEYTSVGARDVPTPRAETTAFAPSSARVRASGSRTSARALVRLCSSVSEGSWVRATAMTSCPEDKASLTTMLPVWPLAPMRSSFESS